MTAETRSTMPKPYDLTTYDGNRVIERIVSVTEGAR